MTRSNMLHDGRWVTVSNVLSLSRLCLAPVLLYTLYTQNIFYAFLIFLAAGVSDLLDGYLARLLQEQTQLGRLLDPLADKIFMVAVFFALSFFGVGDVKIPLWFALFIALRETIMIICSLAAVWNGCSVVVRPSLWGKMTTFFQMLFVVFLFGTFFFGIRVNMILHALLIGLVVFSCISMLLYAVQFGQGLSNIEK